MSSIRRNTLIYSVGAALPKLGSFILLPILTHYLTPAEYGTVNAMLIVSAVATIAFTLALDKSVWRLYHDHSTEERKELLGTLMISLAVLATLGLGVALLAAEQLQRVFPSTPFVPYYLYALLAAYFGVFAILPKMNLQITEQAVTSVTLASAEFAVTNALILWFVIKGEGAAGMLRGQMLGALAFSLVYLALGARMIKLRFRTDMLRASIKFSAPLLPNMLFAWVLSLSDRLFLGHYRSMAEVGVYSAGYRVGSASTAATGSFYQAYNPVFYRLANSEDQVLARAKIDRYNTAFLAVAVSIGFAIAFLIPEVTILLFPSEYQGMTRIVQIVAMGYVVSQAQGLLELQIYQEKRTVGLMWVYAAGATVNIGLNFILVPTYGIQAAAWTTTVAFGVMFAADYWYARRVGYFVPFRWLEVSTWLAVIGALLSASALAPLSHPVTSLVAKGVVTLLVFASVEARYGVLGVRRMVKRFATQDSF